MNNALVTYITIFIGATLALAVIVSMMQHIWPAAKKREGVL